MACFEGEKYFIEQENIISMWFKFHREIALILRMLLLIVEIGTMISLLLAKKKPTGEHSRKEREKELNSTSTCEGCKIVRENVDKKEYLVWRTSGWTIGSYSTLSARACFCQNTNILKWKQRFSLIRKKIQYSMISYLYFIVEEVWFLKFRFLINMWAKKHIKKYKVLKQFVIYFYK